jgi:hypothetical protein
MGATESAMETMKTILITNNPDIAADAEAAGVSRIMIDLESIGKKKRQMGRGTFISNHRKEDIVSIRRVLKKTELIVRINPWYPKSGREIDYAIDAGAQTLMLPMIIRMSDLDAFIGYVGGRAKPIPLVETGYSMAHIRDIASHSAIKEVYIGFNDLHLSLGLDFLFEPLSLGLVDWMAEQIRARGKPFGFAGIAAMGNGELPAERILGEHARLGSTCVILSSRFCKDVAIQDPNGRRERLKEAIRALQGTYRTLCSRTQDQQDTDAGKTFAMIRTLANAVRKRKTDHDYE